MTENRQAYIIPPLMDLPPFSNTINPWQLAAEKGRLVGEIALAALPRLAVLNHADGKAAVALAAGVDENGVHYIKAEIQADIDLDCQRCLGSLRLPVTVTVALGLIRSEAEAERLLERYEPLLVADGDVAVADLVEDELLLALPQIPRHEEPRECEANGYTAPDEARPGENHRQPFAALASLLSDLKRST